MGTFYVIYKTTHSFATPVLELKHFDSIVPISLVGRVKIAKIEQFSVFSLNSSSPSFPLELPALSDQKLSVRYSQLLQYIVMFQSYLSSIINRDCFYTKKGIISLPVRPSCFVWIKCLKTAVLSVMERWNGIKSI